jgi:hypothetical protein
MASDMMDNIISSAVRWQSRVENTGFGDCPEIPFPVAGSSFNPGGKQAELLISIGNMGLFLNKKSSSATFILTR